MRLINYRFLIPILGLVLTGIGYSQQLNLFEEIETSNNPSEQARTRTTAEGRSRSASPEFTLVGTSRLGSKYSAIIQRRGGDIVVVKTGAGSSTQIPGYAGFSIVDIRGGRASIIYPENVPCVEFLERGVSCDVAANIVVLSLANGEPLASERNQTSTNQTGEARINEEETGETPVNPFEALRTRANNTTGNSASSGNQQFSPRRIAPEDVPPGMRVVSTPFGDRLVEQ